MSEQPKLYTNAEIERGENAEVTITADIPAETLATYRPRALKKLDNNTSIPGFRKGHIPEKLLVERLGEAAVLEETVRLALADVFPVLALENKLAIIGHPHITITKLAPGNPATFKVEAALMPEVALPDYTAIARDMLAQKEDSVEVTDADVDRVVRELRMNKWRIENKERAEKGELPTDSALPEFSDELVQNLGDFKKVSDFRERLRADLGEEKKRKLREKRRIEMGEKIIERSTIPLPELLVEHELSNMLAQLKADVARANVSFEDYLSGIKKSAEDIRTEWRPSAKKRAKLQLVLNKIAEQEEIKPEKEAIEREVKRLLSHHKDADPARVRNYVETILGNEAVFQFLENEGKPETASH